ncbi:MAG: YeeE/YedE thiosulfate transporter family protein [Chloroflexota bacterium]
MITMLTLAVGFVFGFLAQRSRFCTVSTIRSFVLTRDWSALQGVAALFATTYLLYSLAHFAGLITWVPPAVNIRLLPLAALVLGAAAGLGFVSVLAGACPARQHVLAGEGHRDAWFYLAGFAIGIVLYGLVLSRLMALFLAGGSS